MDAMKTIVALLFVTALLCSCTSGPEPEPAPETGTGVGETEDGVGVRLIPIDTPQGSFEVWTRRVGDNPRIKVLLLHGGPGASHEYLLNFEDQLPAAGVEFYFYDQLGSFNSDRPDDPDLWVVERFVDEVEQVRQALGLDESNFYLWGSSWGGLLAIEYALEHQENLKGLVISNMMASIPAYNDYAKNVLMASMDPEVLAEIRALEAAEDYDNPRYMELLIEHHYVDHVLRRPADQWPDYVNATFEHLNSDVYVLMQGPSELGASGRLESWDRTADLGRITVPTLVIGATHDTMDPEHMRWMAGAVANGRFLLCPDGSHMAHIDDEQVYFDGLIRFLNDVDEGGF
jgi:proline iminopeptidase